MLGNAAGLAAGDIGVADRIQKGSLTMVNVAHDADDRVAGDHLLSVFLIFLQKLCNDIFRHFTFTEDVVFHRDLFRFLVA